MSRYIELIFDNSASMDTELSPGRKRIDVAKELFRTEIAPTIGKMGDHITLRLLPENCEFASKTSVLSNHRNEMLQTIDSVKPERTSTALYKSVKEAADECAAKNAHEKIIFILTDGDDNCHSEMEWLIDNQTRQMIRQYNVLLVQLAVNDPVTQNNLASFSNYIGARSYSIGSEGRISNEAMRDDLRFALSDSGLNSELSVKPCLDFPLNYPMRSWDELQQEGFNMYKATLLHEEGFLSFKPEQNQLLKPIEFIELKFLYGLRFKSALPREIVATMLSNLEKPYRYDSNCIYWDFYHAKWRYFQRPAPISIMPQERNKMEDNLFHTDLIEDVISVSERYLEDDVYVVRHLEEDYSDQKGFTIFSPPSRKTEFTLEPYRDKPSRIKKLKYGDLIKFVKNTK